MPRCSQQRTRPRAGHCSRTVDLSSPVEPEASRDLGRAGRAAITPAQHKSRFVHTLEMTPPGDASKAILEMGAYMQITPALKFKLGYGKVRGCYYGKPGRTDHKSVVSETGEIFECDVDHFDAEQDVVPYADATFDTVLCCELIEHLFEDPMHMMREINRILKPGGHLVLTTPNIGSHARHFGDSAGLPSVVLPRLHPAAESRARSRKRAIIANTCRWKSSICSTDAGFEMVRLETGEFLDEPHPEFGWIDAPAGAISAASRSARRRNLRPRPQDRAGEGTLARMALLVSAAFSRRRRHGWRQRLALCTARSINRTAETWSAAGWLGGRLSPLR